MNGNMLLALGASATSGWFITEGLMKGRIMALPVEFDRKRKPVFFWLAVTFYGLMAAIMWAVYLNQSGII